MSRIDPNTNFKIDHLDKTVNFITWALFIIVITLMFALGAIFNDYLAMKQATYLKLVEKVDILIQTNNTNTALEQQLKEIKAKYPYIKY